MFFYRINSKLWSDTPKYFKVYLLGKELQFSSEMLPQLVAHSPWMALYPCTCCQHELMVLKRIHEFRREMAPGWV